MMPWGEVVIQNVGSGKVLTATDRGDRVRLRQGRRRNSDESGCGQRWRLVPVADANHRYVIVNVATGMVLAGGDNSGEDPVAVSLGNDHGGAHQQWRLVRVGQREREYALINVASDRALDVWDGSLDDDATIAQVRYWHGPQQRWLLDSGKPGTSSRAVLTIARNENVFLPIWLRYYRQFFPSHDVYVLDHQSTDGSTDGEGFIRIPVFHPEYGAGWQRDIIQRYQHELIERYEVVLYTDVDEIVAPDPRLGDLGTYMDHFGEDFVTCQGYEVLHQKDQEPPFNPNQPVLGQRFAWYANPMYSKTLLARVPMLWHGGFHHRIDGVTNNDPNLYLIHLHRMDYDICLARHRTRTRFSLAQIDQDHRWGYQNQITDPTEFFSWFFHDSGGGPATIQPQPIPSWWRDLV